MLYRLITFTPSAIEDFQPRVKARFGLMSVLARLGARANWRRLEAGFIDERGL